MRTTPFLFLGFGLVLIITAFQGNTGTFFASLLTPGQLQSTGGN